MRGNEKTRLNISCDCETHTSLMATMPDWTLSPKRGKLERSMSIGELLNGRQGFRMDGAPTWVVVHRAVPPHLYAMNGGYSHASGDGSYYYLRVTQENGQMAWASPVWLGA